MADSQNSNGFNAGQQYLSKIYAKAFLGVTERAGITEQAVSEIDSFLVDVLDKLPNFEALLCSPRVTHEEKERLLDRSFAGKMSPSVLNFLKVVSRHSRLDCLRSMVRAIHQLLDHLRGRVEVLITTAVPMPADVMASVESRLATALGKSISLTSRIDPQLVGGFVVRIGDTVYDGSVSNRLQRMREETLTQSVEQLRGRMDRLVAGA
ncbi:MAG: synthase subunit delta, sodium ion specific [Planctomycetota bacterium]|jgi:F-type H+-transporting ATPase subunit delta